jgi:hypothetical protein
MASSRVSRGLPSLASFTFVLNRPDLNAKGFLQNAPYVDYKLSRLIDKVRAGNFGPCRNAGKNIHQGDIPVNRKQASSSPDSYNQLLSEIR